MQHAMFPQFTSFGLEIRPKAFARCRKALKWIQVSFSSLSRQFTSIYLNTSKWFKIGLHRFAKTNPFHSGNLWSVNQIRSASSQGVVRCRRETERQTWRNCRNKSYELDRLKVAVKVMWKFWQKRVEQIKVSRKYPSNFVYKGFEVTDLDFYAEPICEMLHTNVVFERNSDVQLKELSFPPRVLHVYISHLRTYFGSRLKQEWSCDYLFCWAHLWIISRSASLRGSRFGNNIFFGVSKLKRWAVYALAWSREGRKECKAGTAKGTSVECSCVELVVEWGQIIMSGLLQHIDHHLWNQSVWRWW